MCRATRSSSNRSRRSKQIKPGLRPGPRLPRSRGPLAPRRSFAGAHLRAVPFNRGAAPDPGSLARGGPSPRAAPSRARTCAPFPLTGAPPRTPAPSLAGAPRPAPLLRGRALARRSRGGPTPRAAPSRARTCAPSPLGAPPRTPAHSLAGAQQSVASPRVAPRTVMRRSSKARRGRIPAVFDREATGCSAVRMQPLATTCQPRAPSLRGRALRAVPFNRGAAPDPGSLARGGPTPRAARGRAFAGRAPARRRGPTCALARRSL